MSRPFPLYHWSPTSRRASILRHGLVPGKLSRDGSWRPPYVCFAASPLTAWALSGHLSEDRGDWDLWMTHSDLFKWYMRRDWPKEDRMEYRTRQRVYKRMLWHVGIRSRTL